MSTSYVARPKDWIQTYSGRQFWPLNPKSTDVRLVDIAHALSNRCRYSGHCQSFYSVAEHSVYVSRFVAPENALWGLLHDAAEAYLPDVPRPIKPMLAGFKKLEDRVMAAVCWRYGLPLDEPADVKRIDTAILGDEMEQVMGPPPASWQLPEEKLGVEIAALPPDDAESLFLDRFAEITGCWAERST